MRFGMRVPPCAPTGQVADFVAQLERDGFDYAWLVDSQLLNRDVWVAVGALGARTNRIVLGTNVTNPLTRHPTVTASAAISADELTGGRFILGIGSGESSVRVMGWKTATLAQMRESVEMMRQLWDGEWIAPHGKSFHIQYASGRRIPIYLAATRPRMLQLAGEIADGVIMVTGISKEALEYGFTNIEIGAKRTGRKLQDLEIATGLYAYTGADPDVGRCYARPMAGLFAMRFKGTERDFGVEIPESFGTHSIYPDLVHPEDWDAANAVSEWVTDEMIDAFLAEYCLTGSGDQLVEQVRRLERYGVTNLYIRDFRTYDLPIEVARTLASDVLPRFP